MVVQLSVVVVVVVVAVCDQSQMFRQTCLLHSLCYRWFSLPLNAHALIM